MASQALIFVGLGSLTECADIDRQAWNAAFRAHGLRWDWSWDTYAELMRHGGDRMPAERFASFVGVEVDAHQLDETHQRSFAARLVRDVPVRSGVADVLKFAAMRSVPLGFVSRCASELVHPVLAATARARGGVEFDAIIARSAHTRPAPHPDAIEAVMAELGVVAGVAITDTPAGAAAALDAGLQTVAYPGLLAEEQTFPTGVLRCHAPTQELIARLLSTSTRTAAE